MGPLFAGSGGEVLVDVGAVALRQLAIGAVSQAAVAEKPHRPVGGKERIERQAGMLQHQRAKIGHIEDRRRLVDGEAQVVPDRIRREELRFEESLAIRDRRLDVRLMVTEVGEHHRTWLRQQTGGKLLVRPVGLDHARREVR